MSTFTRLRRLAQPRRVLLLSACAFVLVAGALYATLPDVATLARRNPSTTPLMQRRAAQARARGEWLTPRWSFVPLERISPNLQRAVVAAEDAAFFLHDGLDWDGIRDAALRNIEALEVQGGGSTITQQLAKNLYLSGERSLWRKVREAVIARALEYHLSKRRILELYLNVAEWGRGVYGAEAAAQHHFGKAAADVSADEAAWLAAMLPAPLRHDPMERTGRLAKRQQRILEWMGRSKRG